MALALLLVVGTAFGQPRRTLMRPSQPLQERAAELKQLVVMLRGTLGGAPTFGAGIVVGVDNDQMYVATANHVVRKGAEEATDLEALLNWQPGAWKRATVLKPLPGGLDIAAIAIPDAGRLRAPPFAWNRFASPAPLQRSANVLPIGYPEGRSWYVSPQMHVVSSVTANVIQTEGTIVDGHSGGALVTSDWTIMGMVTGTGSLLGESIRIDRVLELVRRGGSPVAAPAFTAATRDGWGPRTIAGNTDDCEPIDAGGITVDRHDGRGGFHLVSTGADGVDVMLGPDFDEDHEAALLVRRIVQHYDATEYCRIGRPASTHYFKSNGVVVSGAFTSEAPPGTSHMSNEAASYPVVCGPLGDPAIRTSSFGTWYIGMGILGLSFPTEEAAAAALPTVTRHQFTHLCNAGRFWYLRR